MAAAPHLSPSPLAVGPAAPHGDTELLAWLDELDLLDGDDDDADSMPAALGVLSGSIELLCGADSFDFTNIRFSYFFS